MSSNRRPWYPWYPKDFVVDEKVQSLSPLAELTYRRALDVMWQANALQLPSNCLRLANALSKGLSQEQFKKAWSEVQFEGSELFKTTECGKWIYSPRLKTEAQKIENISKIRSKLGKKGVKARAKAKDKQLLNQKNKQTTSHTHTYNKETNKEKFQFKYKKKVPLPKDFQLTQDMKDHAKKKRYIGDLGLWHESMTLSASAGGYLYKDWHAAWKNWFNKHIKDHPEMTEVKKVYA